MSLRLSHLRSIYFTLTDQIVMSSFSSSFATFILLSTSAQQISLESLCRLLLKVIKFLSSMSILRAIICLVKRVSCMMLSNASTIVGDGRCKSISMSFYVMNMFAKLNSSQSRAILMIMSRLFVDSTQRIWQSRDLQFTQPFLTLSALLSLFSLFLLIFLCSFILSCTKSPKYFAMPCYTLFLDFVD